MESMVRVRVRVSYLLATDVQFDLGEISDGHVPHVWISSLP